jgi:hypothetical protein
LEKKRLKWKWEIKIGSRGSAIKIGSRGSGEEKSSSGSGKDERLHAEWRPPRRSSGRVKNSLIRK